MQVKKNSSNKNLLDYVPKVKYYKSEMSFNKFKPGFLNQMYAFKKFVKNRAKIQNNLIFAKKIMSLAKKIFDEISDKKLVSQVHLHLMGEPTLHPKLNEILNYARDKNVTINLTTNGSTLVKKKVPKLLESISGTITASLMTPTEETYEIRGDVGLSWDRYIDNFRLLVREHLNRISKGEKINYSITMRIMVSEKNKKGTVKVLECSQDIQENWNEWSNFVESVEKELGLKPFKRKKIDPDKTFSDDPLRMLRAVRFAAQLNYTVAPVTIESITRNVKRLEIISWERIRDEVVKSLKTSKPKCGREKLIAKPT